MCYSIVNRITKEEVFMTSFDSIKQHFLSKKEEQLYVYQGGKQSVVNYVIDNNILGLMLVNNWRLNDLVNKSYIAGYGFYEDCGMIFERIKLTKEGKKFYNSKNMQAEESKYLKALDKLNKNEPCDDLENEKKNIQSYCKLYGVRKLYRYEQFEKQSKQKKVFNFKIN